MPELPAAVIVDVDGTLATRVTDRSPYDWLRVGEDAPVAAVITAVKALHAAGHAIVVVSGRDDECYRQTASWLTHHLGVPFAELFLRPAGDNRRDDIVKKQLYKRHIKGRYDVQQQSSIRRLPAPGEGSSGGTAPCSARSRHLKGYKYQLSGRPGAITTNPRSAAAWAWRRS